MISILKKGSNVNNVNKEIVGKGKYISKTFPVNQISEIPENRY